VTNVGATRHDQQHCGSRRHAAAEKRQLRRFQPVAGDGGPPHQKGRRHQAQIRPPLPFPWAPFRGAAATGIRLHPVIP
jgi:hypothetical protein